MRQSRFSLPGVEFPALPDNQVNALEPAAGYSLISKVAGRELQFEAAGTGCAKDYEVPFSPASGSRLLRLKPADIILVGAQF